MDLLIQFIVLTIANVIISTIQSITTVKCGKYVAALVSSIRYGFNVVVTVYMLCELPLLIKATIVALCNLVGVFLVKFVEEKLEKDRLWKVEATIPHTVRNMDAIKRFHRDSGIEYNYIDIEKHWLVNFYCESRSQTAQVKDLLHGIDKAKLTILESKPVFY